MGTETLFYCFNLGWQIIIWRYSPRNGDGNNTGTGEKECYEYIWRYSPRNGDGNGEYPKVCVNLQTEFGDIVPGMGTETAATASFCSLVRIWRYSPRNGDGNNPDTITNTDLLIWRYSPRNGDGNLFHFFILST